MAESDKYRGALSDKFENFEQYPEPTVWQGVEASLSDDAMRGKLYTTLAGVEVDPGIAVWDGIAAGLQPEKKKKRRAAFWWWSAAASIVGLGAFIWLATLGGNSPSNIATYQPRLEENGVLSGNEFLSNNNRGPSGVEDQFVNNNRGPSGVEDQFVNNNRGPSPEEIGKDQFANENRSPSKADNTSENNNNNNNRGPSAHLPVGQGAGDQLAHENRNNRGQNGTDNPFQNNANAIPSDQNLVQVTTLQKIAFLDPVLLQQNLDYTMPPCGFLPLPTFDEDALAYLQMSTGSQATQNSSGSSLADNTTFATTSGTGMGLVEADNSAAAEQAYSNYGNPEYTLPFSYGMAFNFPISKRWSLESGLSYSIQNSRSAYSGQYGAGDGQFNLSTRLRYIGVPVLAKFNILKKKKFTWYTSQGLLPEIALKSVFREEIFQNDELQERNTQKLKAASSQLSVNIGTGVEYTVLKRFGVYAQPHVSYYLIQDGSIYNYQRNKALWPGLQAGIRMHMF